MPRISMPSVAQALVVLNDQADEMERRIEDMTPGELRNDILRVIEVSREARRVWATVARKWQQAQHPPPPVIDPPSNWPKSASARRRWGRYVEHRDLASIERNL